MAEGELLTMSDIARAAGVSLAAVSNWRRRHGSFPEPSPRTGDRFSADRVAQWLDRRKIAVKDLRSNEPHGTSYGDRFRLSRSNSPPAAPHVEHLWRVVDSLRGATDVAVLADAVLGLLWLCVNEPAAWDAVAHAGDDRVLTRELERRLLRPTPFLTHAVRMISSGSHGRLAELVRLIDQGWRSEDGGSRRWIVAAFESLHAGFAEMEGRRGAEFFTPSSPVRLMTALVAPSDGDRVLDPCCGAGQFLVSAAAYVAEIHGPRAALRLAGQTIGERFLWLASLNLAVHGHRADLEPGLALTHNLYAGQKFDVVLTNPPFNLAIEDGYPLDSRWKFGAPSAANANFAWLQHAAASLDEGGRAAVVMVNSAATSTNRQDAATRRAMVDAGVVEALVALPPRLFAATAIPVTVWLLGHPGRKRRGEVLFIDAAQRGERSSRARRILTSADIDAITQAYREWGTGEFSGVQGFAASATVADIAQRQYRLAPAAYVGAVSTARPAAAADVRQLWLELMELGERASAVDADVVQRLGRIFR